MLSCTQLCKELESQGYHAYKKNLNLDSDDTKNQILGIVIETGCINKEQAFCVNGLLSHASSIQDASNRVIKYVEECCKLPESVDYSEYLTKEHILDNVQLGFDDRYWKPFITRDSIFPGVQEYCYIWGTEKKNKSSKQWTLEIRQEFIESAGITEEELWEAAVTNISKSESSFVMKPTLTLLKEPLRKILKDTPLKDTYSITSDREIDGAVQVFNPELRCLCEKYSVDTLIMYPQSFNNVVVGPDISGVIDAIREMAENDTTGMSFGNSVLYKLSFKDNKMVLDSMIEYTKRF